MFLFFVYSRIGVIKKPISQHYVCRNFTSSKRTGSSSSDDESDEKQSSTSSSDEKSKSKGKYLSNHSFYSIF